MFILLVCLIAGCVSAKTSVERLADKKIEFDRTAAALVIQPNDGGIAGKLYPGSGAKTAFEFARAFKPLVAKVDVSSQSLTQDEVIIFGRENSFRYVVIPQITHWEDRATQWSELPDRVEIQVTLIDTNAGDIIDSSQISANTSDFEMTDEPAGELVKKIADQYVAAIAIR